MCLEGMCGMGRSEFKSSVVVYFYIGGCMREDTRSSCSDQQYTGGFMPSISSTIIKKNRIHS